MRSHPLLGMVIHVIYQLSSYGSRVPIVKTMYMLNFVLKSVYNSMEHPNQ